MLEDCCSPPINSYRDHHVPLFSPKPRDHDVLQAVKALEVLDLKAELDNHY